jgi:hypothetical protein
MNRRKFFQSLTIGVAAAIVAPKLLIPKEKNKFITFTNPDGIKMTWISKQEWDFEKKFIEQRERIWWQHGIN